MFEKLMLFWIYALSFIGGMINTVCITYFATTVSHFTGVISSFSFVMVIRDSNKIIWLGSLIVSFVLGNLVSGLLTNEREFNLKKRYGLILIGLSLLLLISKILSPQCGPYFILVLPFILGAQNGLIVSYKGIIIRTTHMTGNLTDFGVYIGYLIRGKKDSFLYAMIPLFSVVAFIFGGIIGVLLFIKMKYNFFYLISLLYFITGTFYFILRLHFNKN